MKARSFRGGASALLLMVVLATSGPSAAAQGSDRFQGRSLADALRVLQARGLRIVFTSAVVPPGASVRIEPRGTTPRQLLDDLLAAHGLEAKDGPGGTIQIVRARVAAAPPVLPATGVIEGRVVDALTALPLADVVVHADGAPLDGRTNDAGRFLLPRVNAGTRIVRASTTGYVEMTRRVRVARDRTVSIRLALPREPGTYHEHVTVGRPEPHRMDPGVASETSLERGAVERLRGSLADDPIRVVHAFPRVWAIDDFRSDFSVRGSPFRHADLVIDGASTQWLQHTAYGRGATGSLAMFAAPVLENITLRAGAYPRRHGDRLGPQLDLTLREGSRERFELRSVVGGTTAMLLGEGPLGRSGSGSWLAAGRQSLLEWPTDRADSTRTAFGFTDGLAKVVYDLRPGQQVGLSVVAGMSNIDGEDNPTPDLPSGGATRASVVNLSWRSTVGSALVLTNRVYAVGQRFVNTYQTGQASDRGAARELVYRVDVARPIAGGLLEAGAQVGRTTIRDRPHSPDGDAGVGGSSWLRSAYAHVAWVITPALTLSPGLRVSSSTLAARWTMTPWILGEWAFRPAWTLHASAGVSHQPPDLRHVLGSSTSTEPRAERAAHLDVGIEQRVTKSIRWQATVFSRSEADILREPDVYPRLVDGAPALPWQDTYANGLQGTSRGLELVVQRRSETGLSGWMAYSYARSRYTDPGRHETFWADFDQRHGFSLAGEYQYSSGASVGATFRAGSNFPIPGYFASRDGSLFVAQVRNGVRLPPYVRLDLRAARGFEYLGRRLTLFVEVLNVLNRANAGRGNGRVDLTTGEAIGFVDTLFRRRASGGVLIEF